MTLGKRVTLPRPDLDPQCILVFVVGEAPHRGSRFSSAMQPVRLIFG